MMSDRQVEQAIKADLQQTRSGAGRLIYLEGVTDPDIFFGLLGIPAPRDGLHQQTLVKGLHRGDWGSGNETVRRFVQVARARGYTGKVFGIVDGDGADWASLVAQFDLPHAGPLFAWKAYSIESLLPQVGWPASWGAAPDWVADLDCYPLYVALNRLHVALHRALETLDIHTFSNPDTSRPLRTEGEVAAALTRDQHLLTGRNIAGDFTAEVGRVRAAFAASLAEGLATLNGKWLFSHFLPTRLGWTGDVLRRDWISHAIATGGMADVRNLWQRITGSAP
jgi:hypothetical protein